MDQIKGKLSAAPKIKTSFFNGLVHSSVEAVESEFYRNCQETAPAALTAIAISATESYLIPKKLYSKSSYKNTYLLDPTSFVFSLQKVRYNLLDHSIWNEPC